MKAQPTLVAPSFLSADFLHLADEVIKYNGSSADWFHLDVMDGTFVPNISFGIPVIAHIKKISAKPLDVHLMIQSPEHHIAAFRHAGADHISVHAEACTHLHRTIQQIKETGAKAGVALNPHTPVTILEHLLMDIDIIVLMSVNPGFGGQPFIYGTLAKIRKLRSMLDEVNSPALIEIDGGVGMQNAEAIIKAGADVLVAGNSVFRSPNPLATIDELKNIRTHTSIV
jgi:ribulose-phosphate 3-epimerase